MSKQSVGYCKKCTSKVVFDATSQDMECDDCFFERVDSLLDLRTTIATLARSLNETNRAAFLALSYREQQWIALQAHDDGIITYTGVKGRNESNTN